MLKSMGDPWLRSRYLSLPIGIAGRDQWLLCMNRAMEETGLEEQLRKSLT